MSKVKIGDFRDDIVAYLKSKGWTVVVAGHMGIQKPRQEKFNYQFFFDFTGSKKKTFG